jgi:hypothetical protein
VPGSAEASLQMPPPKPLPAEEIVRGTDAAQQRAAAMVTSGMVAHDKLVGSLEEGAVL